MARHPYTRMLLDAVPKMHATGRPRTAVPGAVPNPLNPPPGKADPDPNPETRLLNFLRGILRLIR